MLPEKRQVCEKINYKFQFRNALIRMVITVRNSHVLKQVLWFVLSTCSHSNSINVFFFDCCSSTENSKFITNEGDKNAVNYIVSFRLSEFTKLCYEGAGIFRGNKKLKVLASRRWFVISYSFFTLMQTKGGLQSNNCFTIFCLSTVLNELWNQFHFILC